MSRILREDEMERTHFQRDLLLEKENMGGASIIRST